MKKKILYIVAIIICLSIIAGGTLAHYTAKDTARNVITSGGIDLEILEYQSIGGSLQPWPNQPIPVMPATTVSKIVSIRSLEQPAWIRMNYTVTVYDAEGNVMDVSDQELARVIGIQTDSSRWTQKSGWWYYNTAIKSGETTAPLFEEVVFSGPHMDNKYQQSTVVIDVNAQAVQKANNGKTVWEAKGWPAN